MTGCDLPRAAGFGTRRWAVAGSVSPSVRKASSALRTISSAGSLGLLRCSISASVDATGGRSGRTMMLGDGVATATSGTIDMPRFNSTAVLSASIAARCIGARGNGTCPESQRITSM